MSREHISGPLEGAELADFQNKLVLALTEQVNASDVRSQRNLRRFRAAYLLQHPTINLDEVTEHPLHETLRQALLVSMDGLNPERITHRRHEQPELEVDPTFQGELLAAGNVVLREDIVANDYRKILSNRWFHPAEKYSIYHLAESGIYIALQKYTDTTRRMVLEGKIG